MQLDHADERAVRRAIARGAYALASNLGEELENRRLVLDIDQDLEALTTAYPDDEDVLRMKDSLRFLHGLGPISPSLYRPLGKR